MDGDSAHGVIDLRNVIEELDAQHHEDAGDEADDELAPSPETEYMRSLVWQELKVALAELPSEQREVFELMELEGFSVKEVSELISVPANTVLSRKHYAVKFLRKRLEGLYNDILTY